MTNPKTCELVQLVISIDRPYFIKNNNNNKKPGLTGKFVLD